MRATLTLIIIGLYAGHALATGDKAALTFGEEITLSNAISVEHAIHEIDKLKHKEILLEGKVSKICEKKGCWMALEGEGSSIRVTFKNYSFFVPKEIVEKRVQAQGVLSEEVMEISEARHYAQDAGKSEAEIQQIRQPSKEYRFVATAVKILY